jgi:hypothetical protein
MSISEAQSAANKANGCGYAGFPAPRAQIPYVRNSRIGLLSRMSGIKARTVLPSYSFSRGDILGAE